MDSNEIQTRINAIAKSMLTKGLREPSSTMHFNSDARLCVGGSWKSEKAIYGSEEFHYEHGDNIEAAFSAFEAYVAAMPDAGERRLNEFMTAIGKAIELGREANVDAKLINPLSVLMKKLSENAITHRVPAE